MRHVAIIQGHPDPAGGHLCHALADAYAIGATEAGHGVTRVDISALAVPTMRNKAEFEHGALPDSLKPAVDAIVSSRHLLFVFPLWLGTMPATLKAFLEQTFRPGIAFAYRKGGLPEGLLTGRSAHVVTTMGGPAFAYRWFYGAHGVRGLDRSILRFSGIKPVRKTYLGNVEKADEDTRADWLARMRADGARLR